MDDPHALFREVIAATGDQIAAIRAIRERFGLDLRSAKEVMLQAEGTAASLDEHQANFVEGLKRILEESVWRDVRDEAFILIEPRCPCYCGGEGFLVLVACPSCGTVMGPCDEVAELIRNVRRPTFDHDQSICHPEIPCPVCHAVPYGQFRAATLEELQAIGLTGECYRKWSA